MELLRKLLRKTIGTSSFFYQIVSKFTKFIFIITKESFETYLTLRRLSRSNNIQELQQLSPVPVTLRSLKHPIFVRPGTEDVGMIISTIIREEYGQFRYPMSPEWMLDAGAYIGDTAVYFLSKYSQLKLIALEPNPAAYELARLNLSPYGDRTTLLNKALYASNECLKFKGDFGGASVSVQGHGLNVEGISIPTLMEMFHIPRLNILKMDIEGAEEIIFATNPDGWLRRVDLLIIEIHGSSAMTAVTRALRQNGFSMRRHRSVWYCTQHASFSERHFL